MTDKINLDDYFKQRKITGIPCNSPEDNAIREKINQQMELVRREFSVKSARSQAIAGKMILRSRVLTH